MERNTEKDNAYSVVGAVVCHQDLFSAEGPLGMASAADSPAEPRWGGLSPLWA